MITNRTTSSFARELARVGCVLFLSVYCVSFRLDMDLGWGYNNDDDDDDFMIQKKARYRHSV